MSKLRLGDLYSIAFETRGYPLEEKDDRPRVSDFKVYIKDPFTHNGVSDPLFQEGSIGYKFKLNGVYVGNYIKFHDSDVLKSRVDVFRILKNMLENDGYPKLVEDLEIMARLNEVLPYMKFSDGVQMYLMDEAMDQISESYVNIYDELLLSSVQQGNESFIFTANPEPAQGHWIQDSFLQGERQTITLEERRNEPNE